MYHCEKEANQIMGRKRLGKERKVHIAIKIDPKLKESLSDAADRMGITLSRVGEYAIQRWINAQKHTMKIERMKYRGS